MTISANTEHPRRPFDLAAYIQRSQHRGKTGVAGTTCRGYYDQAVRRDDR